MPKRSPPKVMYRVMLPADLIPRIDKIIHDEQYAGRNDFTVRLIRNYLDEKEEREKISKQYEMFKDEKDRRVNKSLDENNE